MVKVKIMKKELVWDVFNIEDDSKIAVVENSACCLDKKILKEMYSIVSVYDNYTYKQFIDHFRFFVALVGTYDYCDCCSLEELKNNWAELGIYFYMVSHNEWNMIEVEADYFSIQGTNDYDRPFTKATYQDYDSAIKYCLKNNVDINNIVPQKYGEYTPLLG